MNSRSERFNLDYFNRYYRDYFRQNPPRKSRALLKVILKYRQSGVLLDVGCGLGAFASVAHHYFDVTAIDQSEDVIREAASNYPEVDFRVGSVEDLKQFPEADVITVLDVLEHIPRLDEALQRLKSQLKPQGILAVCVPIYSGPLKPIIHYLDRDVTHIHKTSADFWRNVLAEHFEILEWQGIFRYLFFGRFYFHLLTTRLRTIAPAALLLARKRS